jgi:hypothetical protein
VKLCLDPAVSHAVNFELKAEPRAVHNHFESEVEIVKLDSSCRRQPGEETPRDGVEVCRESAHVDEITCVCHWRLVGIAGYKVIGDDEVLTGAEVAGVVECYW